MVIQLNLPIYTEFEQATAQQLAGVYNKPDKKHFEWAVKLCARLNKQRTERNLKQWL